MVADSFLFYYYYFLVHRILVPQARIEPLPPVVEAQSLNHWTTREVPDFFVEMVETFALQADSLLTELSGKPMKNISLTVSTKRN